MAKILGYARVSTELQTTENQRLEIFEYCRREKIVSPQIIEVVVSSRKNKKERYINETLNMLKSGDSLFVSALDRIGRSTIETLKIIDDIKSRGIRLVLIKENIIIDPLENNPIMNMMITMLSAFADLERSFISERTKAGLARVRANGTKLGRKKGSTGKSKYDPYKDKIIEYRKLGLSLNNIVKDIGVGTPPSLFNYINQRDLLNKNKAKLKLGDNNE